MNIEELKSSHVKLKEKLKKSQKENIDLKKEVIGLKSEKFDLLTKIRELCLQLEEKEVELDECIKSFQKKTNESSSYIKQVVTLAEELECAHKRLGDLELKVKPRRGGDLPKFASTPHVYNEKASNSNSQSPNKVNLRRNPSDRTSSTLRERHSHIEPGTNKKDVFSSLPNQKRLSEIQAKLTALPKPTSETIESEESSYSLSDTNESVSDLEKVTKTTKNDETTKNQPIKNNENTNRIDSGSNISEEILRFPYTYWKGKHLLKWLTDFVRIPDGCVRRVAELELTGEKIMKFTDKDIEKKIGINEPLIRKKLLLALDDLRFHGPPGYLHACPLTAKMTDDWVANYWLPEELGLPSRIIYAVKANCVDIRVLVSLNTLDIKDITKLLNCKLTKLELASLKTGVKLLKRLNYNLEVLNKRREVAETGDVDPLVWTNRRLERWFLNIKLDKYLSEFRTCGLHGALLVLEPSFNSSVICKVLNIPSDVAKGCQLKEKLQTLLIPTKSNDSVQNLNKSLLNSYPKLTEDEPTPENTFNKKQFPFVRGYTSQNKSDDLDKQASGMSKLRRSFRNLSKRVSKRSNKPNEKPPAVMNENPRGDSGVTALPRGLDHTDSDYHARVSNIKSSNKFPPSRGSTRTNKNHPNLTSSAPNLTRHHKPEASVPQPINVGAAPKRTKSPSSSSNSSLTSATSSSSSENSVLISTSKSKEASSKSEAVSKTDNNNSHSNRPSDTSKIIGPKSRSPSSLHPVRKDNSSPLRPVPNPQRHNEPRQDSLRKIRVKLDHSQHPSTLI